MTGLGLEGMLAPELGDARRLKLDTLVRLRWLAVIGQSAAVTFVKLELGYALPFSACLAAIGCAAIVNLALSLRWPASHRLGEGAATAVLVFDVLQLAVLLFLTGGLQNPFAVLFLVPVLVGATALRPRALFGVGGIAIACASLLAVWHLKLPWRGEDPLVLPPLYVGGIWAAIAIGTVFTSLFAYRVAEEARMLSAALAATELVLAREQHLSQLDGLAAAAAHELGTPLATIALVARELNEGAEPGTPAAEDTALLREQVERCRLILSKLTSLGEEEGDILGRMTLGHLIEEVVGPHRVFETAIAVDSRGTGPEPVCRRSPGLLYGLGNLVENAVDFARSRVVVEARWSPTEVSVAIRDDGPGFAPEILLRVGDPYVTSRGRSDVGGGLGLGLFIAKTLVGRGGGELTLANAAPSGGAVATVRWRREAFEIGAATAAGASPTFKGAELLPI